MDYRRHIRLVGFAVLVQGLFHLRNILLLPILTRCLGPASYGVWGKIHAFTNVLVPVMALGVLEGMRRFLPAAERNERRVLFAGAAATLTAGGAVVLGVLATSAPWLARVMDLTADGDYLSRSVFVGIGFMLIFKGLGQLCVDFYRHSDRPLAYGLATAGQVGLVVAVALAGWRFLGATQWTPIAAWGIGPLLVVAVCLAHILWDGSPSQGAPVEAGPSRAAATGRMVRFGVPLTVTPLLVWCMHSADRYMIGWLRSDLGNEAVGIYTANYALGGLVALVFSPLWAFYMPAVTRLWDSGEWDQARHLTAQTTKYGLVLMVPVILAAPVLGDAGIRLVTGDAAFRAQTVVLFFVMVGYALHMLGNLARVPLQLALSTGLVLRNSLLAAAINLALNGLLIPREDAWGGLTGAALATALGFGAYVALNRYSQKPDCHLPLGGGRAVLILVCGAISAGVVRLQTSAGASLWIALVVGGAMYVLLLLGLRVVRVKEVRAVWGTVAEVLGCHRR